MFDDQTKKKKLFMFILPALLQVLADEGKAKAVAFDEIDKAPEEKKRGITIATVTIQFRLQHVCLDFGLICQKKAEFMLNSDLNFCCLFSLYIP